MKYELLDQSPIQEGAKKKCTLFEKSVLGFLDSDKKYLIITAENKTEKSRIYSQFSHWRGKYPIQWLSSGLTIQISRKTGENAREKELTQPETRDDKRKDPFSDTIKQQTDERAVNLTWKLVFGEVDTKWSSDTRKEIWNFVKDTVEDPKKLNNTFNRILKQIYGLMGTTRDWTRWTDEYTAQIGEVPNSKFRIVSSCKDLQDIFGNYMQDIISNNA